MSMTPEDKKFVKQVKDELSKLNALGRVCSLNQIVLEEYVVRLITIIEQQEKELDRYRIKEDDERFYVYNREL